MRKRFITELLSNAKEFRRPTHHNIVFVFTYISVTRQNITPQFKIFSRLDKKASGQAGGFWMGKGIWTPQGKGLSAQPQRGYSRLLTCRSHWIGRSLLVATSVLVYWRLWEKCSPEAKYQRCTVHFYRNVFFATLRSKVKLVAKMLKAIYDPERKKVAREKARTVVEKLRSMKLKEAAKKVEDGIEETLTLMYPHICRLSVLG